MIPIPTKDELRARLTELGAEQPPDSATQEDLEAAVSSAESGTGSTPGDAGSSGSPAPGEPGSEVAADTTVDARHPQSVVEPLPVEEKAGPSSIQSREIRPDERPEAVGKTALSASDQDAAAANADAARERGTIPA